MSILFQEVRLALVPDGYQPYPFRANTPESYLDKLRSLAATQTFRQTIRYLQESGRDFATYIYIPDKDPNTGLPVHDRADHCHLLKRIAGEYLFSHSFKDLVKGIIKTK